MCCSLVAVVGIFGSLLPGGAVLDPLAGLVVCAMLLRSGFEIGLSGLRPLVDSVEPEQLIAVQVRVRGEADASMGGVRVCPEKMVVASGLTETECGYMHIFIFSAWLVLSYFMHSFVYAFIPFQDLLREAGFPPMRSGGVQGGGGAAEAAASDAAVAAAVVETPSAQRRRLRRLRPGQSEEEARHSMDPLAAHQKGS